MSDERERAESIATQILGGDTEEAAFVRSLGAEVERLRARGAPPVAAVRADQQGPDPKVTPFVGRLREHADALDYHIPTRMNAETVRLLRSAANAIDRLHGAAPSGADQQVAVHPDAWAEFLTALDGDDDGLLRAKASTLSFAVLRAGADHRNRTTKENDDE